jgi:hypothetical protein
LAYQPPASGTFFSEQISQQYLRLRTNQPPANNIFLSEQISQTNMLMQNAPMDCPNQHGRSTPSEHIFASPKKLLGNRQTASLPMPVATTIDDALST